MSVRKRKPVDYATQVRRGLAERTEALTSELNRLACCGGREAQMVALAGELLGVLTAACYWRALDR